MQSSDMPPVRQGHVGRLRPARGQRDEGRADLRPLLVPARAGCRPATLGLVPAVSRPLEGDAGVVRVEQEVAPAAEAGAQPASPAGCGCGASKVERVRGHAGSPLLTGLYGPEQISEKR